MIEQPMFFAGNPIYRASNERRDPDWVEQALNAEGSCFLPVSNLEFPATTGQEGKLLWGDGSWLKASTKPEEPIFLGSFKGRAHFALAAAIALFIEMVEVHGTVPIVR